MLPVSPRTVCLALAGVLATASPAAALSVDPSEPSGSPRTAVPERRGIDATPIVDPMVAAGLAIAPSLLIMSAVAAAPAGSPAGALSYVAPFTFGLGHFYAGDPARGLMISLGGPVVMLGGAGLGAALGLALRPGATDNLALLGMGGWSAATLYGGFAAFDAYQTAQRKNQLYRPAPVTTPYQHPPLNPPQRPLGAPSP